MLHWCGIGPLILCLFLCVLRMFHSRLCFCVSICSLFLFGFEHCGARKPTFISVLSTVVRHNKSDLFKLVYYRNTFITKSLWQYHIIRSRDACRFEKAV